MPRIEEKASLLTDCTVFEVPLGVSWMNAVNCFLNPLRPNSDLRQTSHCNIKDLSISEVMRIEDMITQVHFY